MLKPRKTRKNRAQITFREDGGTTYYSPNRKPLKHTKEQIDTLAKIVLQRPASIWYGLRAIQGHNNRPDYPYHALRAMSEKEWNFHWQWKALSRAAHVDQVEQCALRDEVNPLDWSWQPEFLQNLDYLTRKASLTDYLIGFDPGRPEGSAMAMVVKGRQPGLFSADAIRTGKSDWQLHAAIAQGPDAVKELIAQRLAALPDTEMPLNRERWAGLIDENQPVAKASRMPLPAGRLKMSREFVVSENSLERGGFEHTVGGNKPIGVHLKQSVPVLNNPELVGVDPYSPDLTTEQKAAIVAEAKINSAYFFSILRNPAPDGSRTTPFTDVEKQEIQLHYEYHHPYHNLDVSTKYYFPVIPSDEVFAFPGRGMTPFTPQHDPDHLNLPLGSKLEDE
jgi:hypothetical protein